MNQRLENAGKKYTKRSFIAFLEGRQNEKWVLGVIGASSLSHAIEALNSLAFHPNQERFEFLRRSCGVA